MIFCLSLNSLGVFEISFFTKHFFILFCLILLGNKNEFIKKKLNEKCLNKKNLLRIIKLLKNNKKFKFNIELSDNILIFMAL